MPSIALDFERTVASPASEVRRELSRALGDLGFQVTSEQVTLIEARRGSHAAGAFLGRGQLPVAAAATLMAGASGGCQVRVHLEDRLVHPAWGMIGQYQELFATIQARLDADLAGLDPVAADMFALSRFTTTVAHKPLLERTWNGVSDLREAAVGRANEVLEGGPRERLPDAWRGLDTVLLRASDGAALLQLGELQAHLAIAVLASSQSTSLPRSLAAQVEAFAARVEGHLAQVEAGRYVEIPIADGERPVVEFLHQQARLREQLPVRTLHRCRACKFERVTNPDLVRLRRRIRRLQALGTSVGPTLGRHGFSPFLLVGSVFRFADLDPDYVCPRCQGTDAEAMVVTFCPSCGTMRPEAALRLCVQCQFDLRSLLGEETSIWGPLPPPSPVAPPLPPAAPPLPVHVPVAAPVSPAKVCGICGERFPALWRTVVAVPGGSRELLVCGRRPTCAPNSLVLPTLV